MNIITKSRWLLFAPVILSVFLSDCEQVKELAAISFNTNLEFSIPVTELSIGSNINYDESMILDANNNPEIRKYTGKIRNIEVQTMEFAIEDYSSTVDEEIYMNNGVIGFGDKSSSVSTSTCNVDAIPVTHWAGTGFFEFSDCNSTLSFIGNALSDQQAVIIFIQGTLTKAPVSFNLKVRMKVKVTATTL